MLLLSLAMLNIVNTDSWDLLYCAGRAVLASSESGWVPGSRGIPVAANQQARVMRKCAHINKFFLRRRRAAVDAREEEYCPLSPASSRSLPLGLIDRRRSHLKRKLSVSKC